MTEEYLLLVHSKNGIRDIGELQGRSVNFYDNSRASLAPMWVRTLLLERGFKPPEQFFRKVNVYRKISHVILPVFFGQVEGCLVTRAGFETMGELNPQIRENLRVLAASPPFVPSVGFYRPGYEPYFLDKLTNELVRMNQTISGRQVLNVFQSDSLGKAPSSVLDSARELYSIHEKSIRKNGAVK
jgi:phosphonate transport system substrate-binding protein